MLPPSSLPPVLVSAQGVARTAALEALLAQAAYALIAAGLFPEPEEGTEIHAAELLDDQGTPTLWGITVLHSTGLDGLSARMGAPALAVCVGALVARCGVRLAPVETGKDDPTGWPCVAPISGSTAHARLAAFDAMADALAGIGWTPGLDGDTFLALASRTPYAAWKRAFLHLPYGTPNAAQKGA